MEERIHLPHTLLLQTAEHVLLRAPLLLEAPPVTAPYLSTATRLSSQLYVAGLLFLRVAIASWSESDLIKELVADIK